MQYKFLRQIWMTTKYLSIGLVLQCLFYSLLTASESTAQNPKSIKEVSLSIVFKDESLKNVFKRLQTATDYSFSYNNEDIKNIARFTGKYDKATLYEILLDLGSKTGLSFKQVNYNVNVARLESKKEKKEEEIEIIIEDINVSGQVIDDEGNPIPGVNILVKGTSNGTITTIDGTYSLNAPEDATLIFSFVGFLQEEVPVNGQSQINVTLYPDIMALGEVVVVGYGTQRKSSVVGSVDMIESEFFEGRATPTVTQALQGASPNLVIQQRSFEPGGAINLNIRGISTLGNNSPLVVIDGIIGGDINLINPADIESVSVLKDAGSAAIYGSRANNGVIVITTKMGKKDTKPTITYNGLAGINSPHIFLEPVSGYENALLRNESAFNANKPAVFTPDQIREIHNNGDEEWFADAILENAWQQNHNLAVAGGSETSTYRVSAGYVNQRNNFVGPDKGFKRYNFRVNLDNQFGRFRLTSILSYARREMTDHSFSTGTLMADAGRVPLYYKQKDSLGNYLTNDVLQQFNPLGILEKGGFRKYDDDNVFGNVAGEFKITEDLKIRGVFGGALYSNHQFARTIPVTFLPKGTYGEESSTNDESFKALDLNTQLMMEFSKRLNERHDINVLLGASNENHTERRTRILQRYTDPELGTPISGTIISTNPDESYNSNQKAQESSLNSLFGRLSYSYDGKYFGEVSFRYDGSSKFREGYRWGFFPSMSLGYRLSEEEFMAWYKNSIGNIKVRGSYGVLGNQSVDNYQYQTTYFTFPNAYGFNNEAVGGTGYNFANPDIQWERAATFNIGADLDFFNRALTVSLDYYNKITRDILVEPAVPGVFGTGLPDFNAGEVENKGWGIAATYTHSGDVLGHTISVNLADSKNKVTDFQGEEILKGVEELQIIKKEGYPINSYVGLKRDGIFQSIDEIENAAKPAGLDVQPGDNRYVDVDGNGIIDDDDLFVFGSPFPRLTYGLTYNLTYKGFDLNIFAQGVGKKIMMIRGESVEPYHYNYGMTMYSHQLDYWTPQNPDAYYPRLADNGTASNTNNFRRGSDMYLYDGAYLRLKNVQVGYTLPVQLTQRIGMQKCRIYLSGQNLLTFSKVKFIDPETTEFDSNLNNGGANSGRAYPTMIFYGAGLDITF